MIENTAMNAKELLFPWVAENRKPRVYFAGKVEKDGFRQKLFSPRIMSTHGENEYMIYVGPSAISCDHGCWHKAGAMHGTIPTRQTGSTMYGGDLVNIIVKSGECPNDAAVGHMPPTTEAVKKCLDQILSSDAVHVYLNSLDCYGTIAEIGYASAIGKPIFMVLDSAMKHDGVICRDYDQEFYPSETPVSVHLSITKNNIEDDLWFVKSLPNVISVIYGDETTVDPILLSYKNPLIGKIYIIKAIGTNRIKIGFSDDPEKRIKQLATGSPYPLQLLKVFEGTQQQERRIHARFTEYRVTGEWFELDGDLAQWLFSQSGGKVSI